MLLYYFWLDFCGGAPLCGITILTSKCTEIMSLHQLCMTRSSLSSQPLSYPLVQLSPHGRVRHCTRVKWRHCVHDDVIRACDQLWSGFCTRVQDTSLRHGTFAIESITFYCNLNDSIAIWNDSIAFSIRRRTRVVRDSSYAAAGARAGKWCTLAEIEPYIYINMHIIYDMHIIIE